MILRNFAANLLKSCLKRRQGLRFSSGIVDEELTVQSFCDLYITLPYNVHIKPLDVHKYYNCDKLLITLSGNGTLKHLQDGNNVKIWSEANDYDKNVTCYIKAPVKANVNVIAEGNIKAGFYNGSELNLKSLNGNITVEKYQGDVINLTTEVGDIVLNGAVLASKIQAQVLEAGNIKTGRLQGLHGVVKTNKGNISVESSYCDEGIFENENGNVDLQNIHKDTRINVKNGNLNMTGFDGKLDVTVNGNADIQIARILAKSDINVKNGDLTLRLSEDCQGKTKFVLNTKDYSLDKKVEMDAEKSGKLVNLMPKSEQYQHVTSISCDEGKIDVQSGTWADMFQLISKEQ